MPYSIVVAGGNLYSMNTSGVATQLTLPTGVTIDSSRPARMAVLGRAVVIVNAPSRSIWVDPKNVVRPLILRPPSGVMTLAAGATGGYSGTVHAAYTNIVRDPDSLALIMESDFSPVSASVTVLAKLLAASGIGAALDDVVTARRLYRSTTGPGAVLFPWIDVDGNSTYAIADDMSDASLGLFAAPTELGSAPGMIDGTRMSIIVEWKGRLWGVGDVDVDHLRFSGDGQIYAWSEDYDLPVQPIGADTFGITGLIRRRDELGVCKRNVIWKVTGSGPDDFAMLRVIEGKGCYAADSVVVIRDVGYFLGEDGVYTWGDKGVECISDDKVRGWFATDTYFSRAQFPNAFAKYNARYHSYELHLAAAGSSNIDRWVSYDITRKEWFGPHLTNAFTPTYASSFIDGNSLTVPLIGTSSGYIMQQNQTAFNDDGTAIPIIWIGKSHAADAPDDTKIFNDLSLLSKTQSGAGALAIGIAIGAYDTAVSKTFTANMTKSRQRFSNVGPGRNVRLEFTESSLNQGVELHGYEIPFGLLGRR